jgi:sigma-B regulation protein RsbU (phosphoserine phosphatase)
MEAMIESGAAPRASEPSSNAVRVAAPSMPKTAQSGVGLKVLVADDELVQRTLLSTLLKKYGYEVIAVPDGEAAWEVIEREKIKIVFTDWMMPKLNGLELIRKIRSANLGWYVYIILCTGKDSKSDVILGLETGADDFLAKPANPHEVAARIAGGVRVVHLEERLEEENKKLAAVNHSLSEAYELIRKDLRATAQLLESLLPAAADMGGLKFDWLFCPSALVAGDIFNFFRLSEDRVGFYHLDVSGHGIQSALLSFMLSKTLQPAPIELTPLKRKLQNHREVEVVPTREAVGELNQRFQNNGDLYFTIAYAIFDKTKQTLDLAQAGHPHPIYLKKGAPPTKLGNGGFPVGVLPEMEYDSIQIQMNTGDRLVFVSDGVTECINAKNEQFGEERLMKFLDGARNFSLRIMLDGLEKHLRAWRGTNDFDDDVSVLACEVD